MPEHLSCRPFSKTELRKSLRARRGNLDPEERQRLSRIAALHIIKSDAWNKARTVALYMAVRGETDTGPLLRHAWENGKTVLLPVCSRNETGVMHLASCPDPDALVPGPFGILEPAVPLAAPGPQARNPDEQTKRGPDARADGPAAAPDTGKDSRDASPNTGKSGQDAAPDDSPPAAPDIIIVPGVAFDANGTRLGMGGGYYDRLLALPRYADSLRLGLAYSFQLVDSLPRQTWDVPVHAVCTELGILWTPSACTLPTEEP